MLREVFSINLYKQMSGYEYKECVGKGLDFGAENFLISICGPLLVQLVLTSHVWSGFCCIRIKLRNTAIEKHSQSHQLSSDNNLDFKNVSEWKKKDWHTALNTLESQKCCWLPPEAQSSDCSQWVFWLYESINVYFYVCVCLHIYG